mgnify:CR=1 FL=1
MPGPSAPKSGVTAFRNTVAKLALSLSVAALLPMLFVSGMMGPYMSPIPANASAASSRAGSTS